MIVAYVSGHGFGHAVRTAEVLRAVRALEPALPIVVVSSAPGALFEDAIGGPLRIRRLECDVGLTQRDALTIDLDGTVAAWNRHAAGLLRLLAQETAFLKQARPAVVLGVSLALLAAVSRWNPAAAVGVALTVFLGAFVLWERRFLVAAWRSAGEPA